MRRVCSLVIGLVVGAVLTLSLGIASPAAAEPPKTHEIAVTKPSGFWTSTRPAERGEEYRYRLLALGVAIAGITGFVMYRLIKRADAERVRRAR